MLAVQDEQEQDVLDEIRLDAFLRALAEQQEAAERRAEALLRDRLEFDPEI